MFGTYDMEVNMFCVIVKMYICETNILLKRIFICIVAKKKVLTEKYFSVKLDNRKTLVKAICKYISINAQ